MKTAPDVKTIIEAMQRLNYKIFTDTSKPFNLNIIGVRSADATPNVFNDWEYGLWWDKDQKKWAGYKMKITTDPGLFHMKNYENPKGVALLKHGQWDAMWALDFHQGKYEALCQRPDLGTKPVTVIRDYDRDNYYDFDSGVEDTGYFGINNHRANDKVESTVVDKWSAGCQVVANPVSYKKHIDTCKEARKYWGNKFTYTLLLEKQL